MDSIDLGRPGKFEVEGEASVVATAWKAWLEEFECFADCRGLFNNTGAGAAANVRRQRQALLFFCGGQKVREVFRSLNEVKETGDQVKPDNYDGALELLNEHFLVKPNVTFQRHMFRKMTQQSNETVSQFVGRLRKASVGCDFHDANDMIKDQVVSNCHYDSLRRKFLEKGEKLDLNELLRISASYEAVEQQAREMRNGASSASSHSNQSGGINRIGTQSKPGDGNNKHRQAKNFSGGARSNNGETQNSRSSDESCTRCGRKGHSWKDDRCPAKNAECRGCQKVGHFQACCRTKSRDQRGQTQGRKARHVEAESSSESQTQAGNRNAFTCKSRVDYRFDKIAVTIDGIPDIEVLVDSGCETNIIGLDTWKTLKSQGMCVEVRDSDVKLFPYAISKPLSVYGCFNAEIEAGSQNVKAEFIIINECKQPSLLGLETARQLGVLKIGIDVNNVSTGDYASVLEEYKDLFDGVGKFTGPAIKIGIDPSVAPVAQPYNRVPFALRDKVEAKLKQLVDSDIIESVHQPTPWISPLVVVPKSNGDIRLCCDMRRPNQAVIRERHPIPSVDELLQDMNQSRIFSKIDLREGFNQYVLTPESRDITTFCTHVGLFRWKRLNYGVASGPERYQAEIQRLVQGIPGVANLADDIIIHASNKSVHDARLIQVFDRLRHAGLTMNRGKCTFGVNELVFVGHKLSAKGVDPTAAKVESVVSARAPANVSELRSWLGLCNYVSKFIADFSTKTEPLRRLTRKDEKFVFGAEQQKAFSQLKDDLASCETLGYFDMDCHTKVIADASPVGIAAILVQIQDEYPRVISYASRSLTDVEQRYCQTEKEALALVWACERFRHYLIGTQFDLVTDHEPLKTIYGPRSKPCARIERWVLRLMPYDYRVVYWPGSKNVADPLSRLSQSGISKACEASVSLTAKAEAHVRFVALNAVPRAMTAKEIEQVSVDDAELEIVRQCIQTGKFRDSSIHNSYKLVSTELCVVGNLVLRGNRIVIPGKLRQHVLQLAHEGHSGMVGTKRNLRTKVWWPNIDKDVETYIKACHGCQIVAKPPNPEPVLSTKLPEAPWQELAVDHFGPFGSSNNHILVVIDYFSRYFECKVVKSTCARTTIEVLDQLFQTHGLPFSIKSDSGPAFISNEFKCFCENLAIKHSRGTPKWPQGNGLAESCMKSIKKRLQIAVNTGTNWGSELHKFLFSYRNTPHPATGKSPAELLFGRKLRTKLPEFVTHDYVDSEVRDHDAMYKAKVKVYTDRKRKAVNSDIAVGDEVLVKRDQVASKTDTTFYPEPFTVVSKSGSQVTVKSLDGRVYVRNSSHLRAYQRTREIIPPSFVGKAGMVGNTDEERRGEEQLHGDTDTADAHDDALIDADEDADGFYDHVDADIADSNTNTDKVLNRRSSRTRVTPRRFAYYSASFINTSKSSARCSDFCTRLEGE